MDYLKQHVVASAPALFVICRYLTSRSEGVNEEALHKALQPHTTSARERSSRGNGVPAVLPASLAVGADLGLLDIQGASRDRRVWTLHEKFRDDVQRFPASDTRAFRSLLLHCLMSRAVAAVEVNERPADIVIALTWLLSRDPLEPLPALWGDGPEEAVTSAGLRAAIGDAEQWRSLMRWARALGLATVTAVGRQKSCLVVDPSRAIEDVLDKMPHRAPADQWFRHLHSLLPVLGDPRLMPALPAGTASTWAVSAATTLAMHKLERAGRLRLVDSADASSVLALRLGSQDRRISEVHLVEEDSWATR